MSTEAARKGKENPDLQLVPGGVGLEEEVSNSCDAVMAASREQECAQGPDIPPAFRGRPENAIPRNPLDLPEFIRREAEWLREWGDDSRPRALEKIAGVMEWVQAEWDNQPLTLQQAAEESGFSYSTIEKKVASEELENVGEKGKPRVRRGDLPKKGRQPSQASDVGEPDPVGDLFLRKLGA
jgi:hypothetical protein